MKVLLTGGAGFIGRHVHRQLVAEGHEVRVFDSLRSDVHQQPPAVDNLIVGDVRDGAAMDEALSGVEGVVHLAAKVGLGVDLDDIDDYVSTNSLGTAVLLRAMGRRKVQNLVYASSMVIYGEGHYECDRHGVVAPGPRRVEDLERGRFEPPCPHCGEQLRPGLVHESARPDPRNTYAASKLNGEHLAAGWARETGGRVAAMRFHNVYGPGMPRNTPYAGVAALFRSALDRGESPQVFEDGHQRRDFIHVHDIATAVTTATNATKQEQGTAQAEEAAPVREVEQKRWSGGEAGFVAFNVGSGTVRTIGEIAEELARAYGGAAPVVTGAYRLGDVRHITASSERIRDELGWKPEYDLSRGIADLLGR